MPAGNVCLRNTTGLTVTGREYCKFIKL